jgi:hypothetical protein
MALSRLRDKYFGGVESLAELEAKLGAQVDRLELILEDFFGLYLFEVFCRVFFERLVERIGETRAQGFLREIEDFIASTLRNRTVRLDIRRVDWAGAEGRRLTSDIMEAVLTVFGG